jgi:methyl coenzyme M reductase subunit D
VSYKVQVYVDHGYYEYEVDTVERAVVHGQAIMQRGVYRHVIPGGLEFHVPRYVRVKGEGLESQYRDKFCRT